MQAFYHGDLAACYGILADWDLKKKEKLLKKSHNVRDKLLSLWLTCCDLWPFFRVTCGKSKSLSLEQTIANGDAHMTTEETPVNKDVTVKQGVFVQVQAYAVTQQTPVSLPWFHSCSLLFCSHHCDVSPRLLQRRLSVNVFCPSSFGGTCCGCRWCSSGITSSSAPSTPCCSGWRRENLHWVNTHSTHAISSMYLQTY